MGAHFPDKGGPGVESHEPSPHLTLLLHGLQPTATSPVRLHRSISAPATL